MPGPPRLFNLSVATPEHLQIDLIAQYDRRNERVGLGQAPCQQLGSVGRLPPCPAGLNITGPDGTRRSDLDCEPLPSQARFCDPCMRQVSVFCRETGLRRHVRMHVTVKELLVRAQG